MQVTVSVSFLAKFEIVLGMTSKTSLSAYPIAPPYRRLIGLQANISRSYNVTIRAPAVPS
jgi:hypothetical protein